MGGYSFFVNKEHRALVSIRFLQLRFWQDEAVVGIPTIIEAESDDGHHTLSALHISTRIDGYNTGRPYYLSTNSPEERDWLGKLLRKLANSARSRAEARTLFKKVQLAVRKRYNSPYVQYFFAGLIAAVCMPCSDIYPKK